MVSMHNTFVDKEISFYSYLYRWPEIHEGTCFVELKLSMVKDSLTDQMASWTLCQYSNVTRYVSDCIYIKQVIHFKTYQNENSDDYFNSHVLPKDKTNFVEC